jgi:hypothetical protein
LTIGYPYPGLSNVLSGNLENGLVLSGTAGEILKNAIGVDVNGAPLPNGAYGILITDYRLPDGSYHRSSFNYIQGNTVAYNNVGIGVARAHGSQNVGQVITHNSIFSNRQLGIDLGNDGVTPNDRRDKDRGPNYLQNYPTLRRLSAPPGQVTLRVNLASRPNRRYGIEFFLNDSCDPTKRGEGKTHLDFIIVETEPDGQVTFTQTLPAAPGQFITALTVQYDDGPASVSEFSNCVSAS